MWVQQDQKKKKTMTLSLSRRRQCISNSYQICMLNNAMIMLNYAIPGSNIEKYGEFEVNNTN